MQIFDLPVDIQLYIYSFDDTMKINFDKVLRCIKRVSWIQNRINKEMSIIKKSNDFNLIRDDYWFPIIHFNNRSYRVHLNCNYPWEQPTVSCMNVKLPKLEWTSICTIQALIRSHDVEFFTFQEHL